MIESNIVAGAKTPSRARAGNLVYGQSITDACIDLETTEQLIVRLARATRPPSSSSAGVQLNA